MGKCIGLLLLMGVLWLPDAAAVNLYIDNVSGSDTANNCQTQGSPCRTFSRTNTVGVAGDQVLLIRGKTYTRTSITDMAIAKANQVFDSYGSGARAIIAGYSQVGLLDWGNNAAIKVENVSGVTIQNLEFAGGWHRFITVFNGNNTLIQNNLLRNVTGNTANGISVWGGSALVTIQGNEFANWFVSPGSYVSAAFVCGGINVAGTPKDGNCLFQDNYVRGNDRVGVMYEEFSTGTVRRNTLTLTSMDPMLYLAGANNVLVEHNVILQKKDGLNENTEFPYRAVMGMGLEAPQHVANRNITVRYNLMGYGHAGVVGMLMSTGWPSETADLQSMYNIVIHNNTVVQARCCGSPNFGPTFAATDGRSTPDPGDWSAITWRDNLLWDNGTGNTMQFTPTTLAPSFTIDRNLYHTATFVGGTCGSGGNSGTNALCTNTIPFVAYSTANTAFGGGNNYNLTSTTAALGSGTGGTSRGAFQPPQLQSVVIANATPNQATWTFNTPFALQSCTQARMSLSGLTLTGCTVTSSSTVITTFSGTVTAGQVLTAGLQQGAVKSTAIGCATAQCATMGLTEYGYFWRHENFPYSGVPVTNQVQTGCAPTVTSCLVPDSATDDHVILTLNTCGSSPVLPASGVTGFVLTEQAVGTKTCSTFTRIGSTDQLDCDTTAIAPGAPVSWTYGQAGATGPTTGESYNCNGAENPLATGWSSGIDSDDPNGFQELFGAVCVKSALGGAGTGSAYRDSGTFGPDSEMWGIYNDASNTGGTSELHLRIQGAGTPTPSSYACRVTYGTNPLTIEIVEFTSGAGATLASTTQTIDSGNSLLCRVVGSTLTVWHSAGGGWSQILAVTDGTITGAGHIGVRSTTGNIAYDSLGGGTYVATGTGNVTNAAGTLLPTSAGSCTNNVATPPAAPVITDIRINVANAQQILGTWDALGGTMTLNGGGCNGFTCTQNGTNFPLASCAVTTSPVIALTTTTPMSAGNTYACSYAQAGGNVTNGTTEIAAFTNTPVLNTLVPVALTRKQYGARSHHFNETGALTTSSAFWLAPQNTAVEVMPGGVVALVFGFWVTGDDTPAEALGFRCQDNGGSAYAPGDSYGGQLVRYAQSGSTLTHLQTIPTRPLTHPSPGTSTYDAEGRVLLDPGAFPGPDPSRRYRYRAGAGPTGESHGGRWRRDCLLSRGGEWRRICCERLCATPRHHAHYREN